MTQLDKTQEFFDNKTLNYDLEQHPLPEIVLSTLQKYYPEIKSLETLHTVVPADKVSELMNKASQDLLKTDFYDHYDTIIQNHVVPNLGTDILIQKFGNLRALIPEQDKISAVLLWHQGRWVGNGLGLRTVWMPFTDCFDSNSMQIMDLDISQEVTRKAVKEKWTYDQLDQVCKEKSWPIVLKPGQAHLFFQEHLHGNLPNRTKQTRVSIDIRILVKDGQPHRKWPGSYFRPLFDRDWTRNVPVLPNEIVVTYSEYESFKTKHIDLHFQTLVIKSYCQKRNISFPYQHGDLEGLNNVYLKYIISNTKIDHLLLFSIFSLPTDKSERLQLLETCLEKKCRVHFCNEEMVLESKKDLEKIEFLRSFTNDWSSPVDQLKEELLNP
jgi:sporadic carbohydrate cluster 2OG-Fe(II) oxygenase/sporadic carbohydrate cluster protein (TIGR04323 family)